MDEPHSDPEPDTAVIDPSCATLASTQKLHKNFALILSVPSSLFVSSRVSPSSCGSFVHDWMVGMRLMIANHGR